MLTLLTLAFAAGAPPDAQLPSMSWDWDRPQRIYVETEVRLPEFIRFNAEFNRNTRVMGYQLRATLSCVGTEKQTARKRLIQCDIEDIALLAGAMRGDVGRVGDVLVEYDEVLTGSAMVLMMREDGRVMDVNLDGLKARNLRTRGRNETLRLVMRHLAAGLEVPTPSRVEDTTWLSNNALLCSLPTVFGTAGPVETVHQGTKMGTSVDILSAGKGLMIPGEDGNRYTCDFSAHTVYDPERGPVERQWSMRGEPTPSSPIAVGAAGYPYTQRGSFRVLGDDERVDVGESGEVAMSGGQTAIQ